MADEVVPDVSDQPFPTADVVTEIKPPVNNSLETDPVSSDVDDLKEIKRKPDAAIDESQKKNEKKDALQALKSAVIVSAVIVAVAGAIFAITKKLKEK